MFQKITAFIVFFGGLGGVLFFIVHVYQGDINGRDEWFGLFAQTHSIRKTKVGGE
jgi:hypothetical protein